MNIYKTIVICIIFELIFSQSLFSNENKSEKIDLTTIKNDGVYELVQQFVKKNRNKIKLHENDFIKLITIGNVNLKNHNNLLKLSSQSLNLLDKWTGRQKIFNIKRSSNSKFEIVIFATKNTFLKFLNYFQKKTNYRGFKFAKQLLSFNTISTSAFVYTKAKQKLLEHTIVALTTTKSYWQFCKYHNFKSHDKFFPEGLSSNMQYELCGNSVRVYTISYEMNRWKGRYNKSWSNSVKVAVKKKDNNILRDGYFLMEIDLVKNSLTDYQQLWSLCRYIIKRSKNKKGATNKLYQLLIKKVNNAPVQKMVKEVFNCKVATLTKNWYKWAYRQKR